MNHLYMQRCDDLLVVERVVEVAWLAVAIVVAFTMRLSVSLTAVRTRTTLRSRATLTFYITFRFRQKYTVRELILACLRVDFEQFDGNLVTFFQSCILDSLQALPVYLADVEQTILARQNLNEATVRHYRADSTLVNLTNFRYGYDTLNLCHCCIDALLVRC